MFGSQKRRCSADNLSTPTALFSGNFTKVSALPLCYSKICLYFGIVHYQKDDQE